MPNAPLPRPATPPSTLCGSSTIRIGRVALMRSIGRSPPGLLAVLVEVVHVLLVDGADGHHHDLDLRAGGEVAHLPELGRVVEEVLERHAGIERPEVVVGELERLVHSLLDRHRRHHDHELGETVALVQLEDRAQVDVGLPGPGFHLDGEVAGLQVPRRWHAVAELDGPQILEHLVIQQGQPVADAESRFLECQVARIPGDRELGSAHLLAAEQIADGLHRLELEVQVGLETELHGHASIRRSPLGCGIGSPNSRAVSIQSRMASLT